MLQRGLILGGQLVLLLLFALSGTSNSLLHYLLVDLFNSHYQLDSSPTSPFIPSPSPLIKDPQNLVLSYKINGKTQQEGNTSDMIFKIDELVEYVSGIMRLEVGDLIITGKLFLS